MRHVPFFWPGGCYGDLLMWVGNQVRPYENRQGDTDTLINGWIDRIMKRGFSISAFAGTAREILKDFSGIPYTMSPKVKVGIVGEIYIKYAPLGNNCLEEFLRGEDAEVVIPGLLDFILPVNSVSKSPFRYQYLPSPHPGS